MENKTTENIRGVVYRLLLAAFTAEDLRRFCQNHPSFAPIIPKFGPGQGMDDMADEVVEYCEKNDLLDELVAAVRTVNPRQYKRFEADLLSAKPAVPPQSRSDTRAGRTRRITVKTGRLAYWTGTALVVVLLIVAGVTVCWNGRWHTEAATVYFVVDTTENMHTLFEDVRQQVQIAATDIEQSKAIGLRVYGGDNSDSSICQESRQLLELGHYAEAQKVLSSVLADATPRGHSSMTGAILDALLTDLRDAKKPIRLILVTSGIDSMCDAVAANIIEARAQDVGEDVELMIISIGEQDIISERTLESYAQAFGGDYVSLANVQDLPRIVGSFSSYGYADADLTSDQVPTPTQ